MAVTIKDIAAAAGVSPSTVSRTCKDSPSISRDTKERIRRIMAQMGYEPNFEAEPSEAFSKTIGIILPSSQRDVYENAFHLEIIRGIGQFVPTRMRMNILRRGEGITILDDTYNANPQSMRAAISVLSDRRSQWSIAVLGDMFELGPFAPALHTGVGECLGKARIDCLVAVGELAEHIAQGARDSGVPLVYHCKDKAEAKPVLDQLVRPGSTILVKASRGMELEELTAYLLSITPEAE